MTKVGFLSLPNELVLHIASDAGDSSLLSLVLCNRHLSYLLTPVLHTRALASRGLQSAIQWAATRGHMSLVKFLLARGMHPDTGAKDSQPPALRAAVRRRRLDIVELLVSHGADVNRHNYDGNYGYEAVIHIAAANGDTEMIKLLAAHGADVVSDNPMGMYVGTPLHVAVTCGHVGAVQTLLGLQAKVDGEDSGYETPLEVAESVACEDANTQEWWESMVEIGKLLVKAGAPVRHTEESLQDLCVLPGEQRNVEFQRIMIAAGQDVTLGDQDRV